jgi:hypothetical protein
MLPVRLLLINSIVSCLEAEHSSPRGLTAIYQYSITSFQKG